MNSLCHKLKQITTAILLTAVTGMTSGCGTNVQNNPDSVVAEIADAVDSDVAEKLNCLGGTPLQTIERVTVDELAYECAGAAVSGTLVPLADGGWLIYGLAETCCTDIAISRMVKLDADGSVAWHSQAEDSLMHWDPGTPVFGAALNDGFVLSRSSDNSGYEINSPSRRFTVWSLHYDKSAWWDIPADSMGNPAYGELVRKSDNDELWFSLKYATVDGNQPVKLMHVSSDGTITGLYDVTSNGGILLGNTVDDDGVVFVFQRTEQDETRIVLIMDAVRMLYDGTSAAPVELGRWEVPAENGSLSAQRQTARDRDSTATDIMITVHSGTATGETSEITMLYVDSDGTLRWTHHGAWSDDQTSIYGRFISQPDGRISVLTSINGLGGLWVPQYRIIAADGQSDTILNAEMSDPLGLNSRWNIHSWFQIDRGELITGVIPDELTGEGKQSFVALYEPDFAALKWVKTYMDPASNMSLQKTPDGWALSVSEAMPWPECGGPSTYETMSILLFDSVCGE